MVYKNINRLPVNKKPNGKKYEIYKKKEWFEKKITLKRIKEYPKVTHLREKWLWTKNGI